MKILKRFLGFFLCFAMLLSVLPMGALAVPAQVETLEDGFIRVDVSRKNGGFLVSTVEGNRLKKSDNNKNLLYHDGQYDTSFVSFRVGEGAAARDYLFGGSYPEQNSTAVSVTRNGDSIVAVWGVEGLTFTQTVSLAAENANEHGMVSIGLAVSGTTDTVRARILLDTCLGSQDYAYYQINGGTLVNTLQTEQTLTDPQQITNFYAVDDIADPAIAAYMISPLTKQITIGHWSRLASSLYDDFAPDPTLNFTNPINDYQTADSACALYYDLRATDPVTLNYGVYSNRKVDLSQSVAVNCTAPLRLNLNAEKTAFVKQPNAIGAADFAVEVSAENYVSDTSRDYENVLMVVSSTSRLRPLDDNGEILPELAYDSSDLLSISYSPFRQNSTINKTLYFKADLRDGAAYERVTIAFFDNSGGAISIPGGSNGKVGLGDLPQDKLLGQKVVYVLLPGNDGNVPRVHFTSMTPKTIYAEGTRHLYAAVANAELMENALLSGNCEIYAVSADGSRSVKLDANGVTFNEGVADVVISAEDTLAVGAWRLQLEWTDEAVAQNIVTPLFKKQTASVLDFTVSNDPKYRNDCYGVIAAVKYGKTGVASTDDTYRYELRPFKDEAEFTKFSKKEGAYSGETYAEILLVYRGAFIGDRRYPTTDSSGRINGYLYYNAVSKETIKDGKTSVDNTITVNNCLDFEAGTMSVYYEDYAKGETLAKKSSVLCEFDGKLYTSVERTSVWTGKAALTKLTPAENISLIKYNKNGERKGNDATASPITLIWPNIYGYGQTLAGMIFKLAYGQFGVMYDGDKEIGRVIGFAASLNLSFMKSPQQEDDTAVPDTYFGRMKELWTDWRGASIYQYAYHGNRFEKLTNISMNDSTEDHKNAQKGVSASVMVPDILFGCGEGFVGLHFTVELAIQNMIDSLPKIKGKLEVNTIGDWSFGVAGSCKLEKFSMEAKLSFKSRDNIPIPDEIYFYVGGFKPGINVDGCGTFWLKGLGGGISNIYDTIFMTSGLPPLKLTVAAAFSIIQVLDGKAKLELSLSGFKLSAEDLKIFDTIEVIKSITLGLQWYPDLNLQASIYVDLFEKTIAGNGYIVLIGKNYKDWEFEMFARVRLMIPESVPAVGGMTLLGADVGIGTKKIWGAIEVIKISLGITYYWGESGVHFGTGGDYAQPSYPSLLTLNGYDGECEDIPIGYDEEKDRYLFAHIGTNLDPPVGAQILSDDDLKLLGLPGAGVFSNLAKTSHGFNLGAYDDDNAATLVQVNFPATSAENAKTLAGAFTVNSAENGSGDALPVKLARHIRPIGANETDEAYEAAIAADVAWNADANANVTYNPDTGLGTFAFTLTDASQFGKDWYLNTGVAADVVLYNVHTLPKLTTVTLTQDTGWNGDPCFRAEWTGVNVNELDKVSFHLVKGNSDPLEEGVALGVCDYAGWINSEEYAIPVDLPSGDYYLRAVYAAEEQVNGVIWSAAPVHYDNPNTPAPMGAPEIHPCGDLKYSVSIPATADANTTGYIAEVLNAAGEPAMSEMRFDRATDETGAPTATTFELGGRMTVSVPDDPEKPEAGSHEETVGLTGGESYTVRIRPFRSIEPDENNSTNGAVIYGEAYSSAPTLLPTPVTPTVTLTGGGKTLKSVKDMGASDVSPVFAGSSLTLAAAFSENVTGVWTLDGSDYWSDPTTQPDGTTPILGAFSGGSAEIALTDLSEGGHRLVIKGKADDGDAFAAEYAFSVDTLPPRLLITSPLNGSPFGADGSVTISGVTDPDTTIFYSVDGGAEASFTPVVDTDGLFSHSVSIPDCNSAATHKIRFYAADASGNATDVRETELFHPGLGTMTGLVLQVNGVVPADGGISTADGCQDLPLALMGVMPGGTVFAMDPDLVIWNAFAAEGTVAVDAEGRLTCSPYARGFVEARYEVSTGAYLTQVLALGLNGREVTVQYTTGGTASGGGTYAPGETVELMANPAHGYGFLGWTLNGVTVSDPAQKVITFVMPETAVTAEAAFLSSVYTVSFALGYETTAAAPAEQQLGYGASVVKPDDPTRGGFQFAGWYCGDALWNFDTDTVTDNMTLTAHWTEKAPIYPTVSITGWTYGEAANAPTLTVTNGTGAELTNAEYGAVTWEYKVKGADDSTYGAAAPTAAGEYTVRASVADSADYAAATDTEDFTVAKASVALPAIQSKVYTGEALTADVPESTLYTVTTNAGGTNVGGYDVVLTLTDPANYKWASSDEASVTLTFHITATSSSAVMPDLPALNAVTYDPAKTLADVTLPDGWSWVDPTVVPTAAVDSYAAKLAVDDVNYNWSAVDGYDSQNHCVVRDLTLTVNKASVALPAIQSKVYTGEALTADVPESTLYTVTANAGGTIVGGYDVVLTLTDPANYKWASSDEASVTLTFHITATSSGAVMPDLPVLNAVTYDPAKTLADAALPDGWSWVDPTTVPTAAVNSYAAKFAVDDVNYNWSAVDGYDGQNHCVVRDLTLTINKAEVALPTVQSKVYTGSLLTADVPASAFYTVTANAGSTEVGSYDVVLTLTDPVNYKWPNSDAADATLTFAITAAGQAAPTVGHTDETASGAQDGTIIGLTPNMEYSTDGTNWTPVPGDALTGLSAGTYYVRCAADANHDASEPVMVVIVGGDKLVVTWSIAGQQSADQLDYGATPAHAAPSRDADADYRYTFTGWNDGATVYAAGDALPLMTKNVTYTAVFTQTARSYGQPVWQWNGSEATGYTASATFSTNDGDIPFSETVTDEHPTAQQTPAGCETAGAKTYTAKVSFHGQNHTGTKSDPIAATGHDYTLSGWTWNGFESAAATFVCKHNASHTETVNATIGKEETAEKNIYTATVVFGNQTNTDVREETRSYVITFVNDDGSQLQSSEFAYGATPVYTGATPVATAAGQYSFSGWTPAITAVTGAATYTATYTATSSGGSSGGTTRTFFPISLATETKHGKVRLSDTRASLGTQVTLTLIPDPGYAATSVVVRSGETTVPLTENADGTWTFRMPSGSVSVEAQFAESYQHCSGGNNCPMKAFTDLDLKAWYHDGVHFALAHGLMNGVGNKLFTPDGTASRAMVVTILWRMEGQPKASKTQSFADVQAGSWYDEAVRWATANGIVNGYSAQKFGPSDPVTREQLAAILYRYATFKRIDPKAKNTQPLKQFKDAGSVASWATDALAWLVDAGIINGVSDAVLSPQSEATRAQIATMLMRFCVAFTDKITLPQT